MDASHPPLEGVHEAALYVDDLDAAERFWRGLGLPCVGRAPGRHVFFRAGGDMLLVFHPEGTRKAADERSSASGGSGNVVPPHGAEGSVHVALSVPDIAALEQWRTRLADAGVAIESEVTWPSGGRSIYFRDPAGNSIEFITRGSWGA
ncbi:MAG: VOC family protein [Longimicrobiales bacterium]